MQAPPELVAMQRMIGVAVMRDPAVECLSEALNLVVDDEHVGAARRLGVYHRAFWSGMRGLLADDFPWLKSLIGADRFKELVVRYLEAHPPQSPNLRLLGHALPEFIAGQPQLLGRYKRAAVQLAELEWAQMVAFDAAELEKLTALDVQAQMVALATSDADSVTLGVQPYVSALLSDYLFTWDGGKCRAERKRTGYVVYRTIFEAKDGLPVVRTHCVSRAAAVIIKELKSGKDVAESITRGMQVGRRGKKGEAYEGSAAFINDLQQRFAEWAKCGVFCSPLCPDLKFR